MLLQSHSDRDTITIKIILHNIMYRPELTGGGRLKSCIIRIYSYGHRRSQGELLIFFSSDFQFRSFPINHLRGGLSNAISAIPFLVPEVINTSPFLYVSIYKSVANNRGTGRILYTRERGIIIKQIQ